jgi:hypothetical protein
MRAAYEEAAAIAREIGDPRLLASALLDLSFVPYIDQDPARTESVLREGLGFAEMSGDRILVAEFQSSLGFLHVLRGDPATAYALRMPILDIYREEKALWKLMDELGGQAMLARQSGDLKAARRHVVEAFELAIRQHDVIGTTLSIQSLAAIENDEGRHERASRLLGVAARMRDELGGGIPPELSAVWGDIEGDTRGALGEEAYDRARAEGYAMDNEAAVRYALGEEDEPFSRPKGATT